jgi:enoyl-CoA hydratase
MAEFEKLLVEKVEDKICRLTLNRPEKLNALSPKLLSEFDRALDEFEAARDLSVLIIRGAGRAFCAGYDLQGTQQPGSGFTVSSDRINLHKLVERWQRLWSLGKPTIAQVHGYCLAGATELAGHCDIVFATGDLMNAKEALECHLVNRVVPKDRLDDETLAYARRVALVPVDLLALHKAAVNRWLDVQGIRALEQSAADLDCLAHQTDTVKQWMKASRERGLKEALSERDRPFAARK